jgi:hypothetical protein
MLTEAVSFARRTADGGWIAELPSVETALLRFASELRDQARIALALRRARQHAG